MASILLVVAGSPAGAQTPENVNLTNEAWIASAETTAETLRKQAGDDADFATVKIDTKSRKVLVYRKGGSALSRYTAAQKEAGVEVEFRQAPLSATETRGLLDEIKAHKADIEKRGADVTSITSEWSGPVTIRVRDVTAEARQLAGRFGRYGPGTVVVEQGDPVRPARAFDTVSRAGAFTNSAGGYAECTSGFAGRSAGNGLGYMITAYHCVNPSDRRFWSTNANGQSGGTYLGTATALDPSHDIAYIRTAGIAYAETWDGPPLGPFVKPVTAMQQPAVGMSNVCTSGARTGARCYGTILGGGWWDLGPYDAWLFVAESNNFTAIAGLGDSGGPVFRPNGGNVTAIGMISAIDLSDDFAVACPTTGSAVSCSARVLFADVYTEAWLNHDINLTQDYIPS